MYTATISQEMLEHRENLNWIHKKYAQLIEHFGDQFGAIMNKAVIAHSENIKALMAALDQDLEGAIDKIVVEFIYSEHPNFVLTAERPKPSGAR